MIQIIVNAFVEKRRELSYKFCMLVAITKK